MYILCIFVLFLVGFVTPLASTDSDVWIAACDTQLTQITKLQDLVASATSASTTGTDAAFSWKLSEWIKFVKENFDPYQNPPYTNIVTTPLSCAQMTVMLQSTTKALRAPLEKELKQTYMDEDGSVYF